MRIPRPSTHAGLAGSRRAKQQGIPLRVAEQDLDHRVHLAIASDDRTERALFAEAYESRPKRSRVGVERRVRDQLVRRLPGVGVVDRLASSDERAGDRLLEQVDALVREAPVDDRLVGEVEQNIDRLVGDVDASRSSRARRRRTAGCGVSPPRPAPRPPSVRSVGARASSLAIVSRHASPVVAPITAMSPRASAGLSNSAAPMPPSDCPVLSRRWISSREQHDVRVRRLVDELEHAVLELAAVLRAGDEAAERHLHEADGLEELWHGPGHDPLRQPLDDRGLADAGRSEQHGIALLGPQQGLDDPLRLLLAAEDRREHPLSRERRQVATDLVEQRRGGRQGSRGTRRRHLGGATQR